MPPRRKMQTKSNSAGLMLPWHRVALSNIWIKRSCVPSLESRKKWATARSINPVHVNNFFSQKKSRAKKQKSNLDRENEGYDLDVTEGGMEEVIVKVEVKEEEIALLLPPLQMPLRKRRKRHAATPSPFKTPAETPPRSPYVFPTSTPDISSSDLPSFPLTPRQDSSPLHGKSFYSPLSLVSPLAPIAFSSAYIDYSSPNSLSRRLGNNKRKASGAFINHPSQNKRKRRVFNPLETPSPSQQARRSAIASVAILNSTCKEEFCFTGSATGREIKREILGNVFLDFLPSNSPGLPQSSPTRSSSPLPTSSPAPRCSPVIKLEAIDQESSLNFSPTNAMDRQIKQEILDDEPLQFLTSETAESSSSPLLAQLTRLPVIDLGGLQQEDVSQEEGRSSAAMNYLATRKDASMKNIPPPPVHYKDELCCFCGLRDTDEAFLPQNKRQGIWLIAAPELPSSHAYSTKKRPPHALEGVHDRQIWEDELYEGIEWVEGGFECFELSGISMMTQDVAGKA